jgi:hypothetical protein
MVGKHPKASGLDDRNPGQFLAPGRSVSGAANSLSRFKVPVAFVMASLTLVRAAPRQSLDPAWMRAARRPE